MSLIKKTWQVMLILLLLAGCAGQPAATAPAAATCPDFRIGVIMASPETIGAQEQKEAYETALGQINQAGGIQKCPLRLVYAPLAENAQADAAQSAMLALADQQVVAVLGATTNNGTKQAAAIANYLKVPLIISADTGDDIQEIGSQWIIRIPPTDQAYAKVAFEMVKKAVDENASVGIFYEHTEFGESAAVTAAEMALNQNLTLGVYQGFTAETADFATLISKLNGAQVDALYLISSDSNRARSLLAAVQESNLGASAVIGHGRGFSNRAFLYDAEGKISKDVENLFLPVPWSADLPWAGGETFKQALSTYRASAKIEDVYPPSVTNVEAHAALTLVAKGMNDLVKNTSDGWMAKLAQKEDLPAFRDALSQALHKTKTTSAENMLGTLAFDVNGQNQSDAYLVQIVKGKLLTVFPEPYAVQEPVIVQGW